MVKNFAHFWDLPWTVPKIVKKYKLGQEDLKSLRSLVGRGYYNATLWTDKPSWKMISTLTIDFPTFLTRRQLILKIHIWFVEKSHYFAFGADAKTLKAAANALNHFVDRHGTANSHGIRKSQRFSDAGRRIVRFLRPQMIFLHIMYWENSVDCLDIVSYFGKMVEV